MPDGAPFGPVGIAGLTGTEGINPPDGNVGIGEIAGTPGIVGIVGWAGTITLINGAVVFMFPGTGTLKSEALFIPMFVFCAILFFNPNTANSSKIKIIFLIYILI
jgi:hypothetical protein